MDSLVLLMRFGWRRIPAATTDAVTSSAAISCRRNHSLRYRRYFHASWMFLRLTFITISGSVHTPGHCAIQAGLGRSMADFNSAPGAKRGTRFA